MARNGMRSSVRLADVERSVQVAASPATVWALIWPAEHAPLYSDALSGSHVPGTPLGQIGERQCHVWRGNGTFVTRMAEVVELDPGRRAVTVEVDANGLQKPQGPRTTYSVVGNDELTLLAVKTVSRVPRLLTATVTSNVGQALEAQLRRIKELLEGGWQPPA